MLRHSPEMITKLKTAGLGWRDEEPSNSTEKLGTYFYVILLLINRFR